MTATLSNMLGRLFTPTATRKPDPYYRAFRKRMKANGHQYRIAGDGYVEVRDMDGDWITAFPHYGDWSETLERYIEEIA